MACRKSAKNRPIGILAAILSTIALGIHLCSPKPVAAGAVTFINDYPGFIAAAGDVRIIDFDTLPDESPSHVGVPITPEFNYTAQGVMFSASTGDPFIAGNSVSGYELAADGYPDTRTWIIADLSPAVSAVGVFFVGGMSLDVYGVDGDLIVESHFGQGGGPWFLGIVSNEPIARATADKGDTHSLILDFAYASIPEPMTGILVLFGSIVLVRKRLMN